MSIVSQCLCSSVQHGHPDAPRPRQAARGVRQLATEPVVAERSLAHGVQASRPPSLSVRHKEHSQEDGGQTPHRPRPQRALSPSGTLRPSDYCYLLP